MVDAVALVAAVETHGLALLRYARYRTPTEEDAEDAVQETWMRAWRTRETLRGTGRELSSWLYRTTHNVVIDKARSRAAIPCTSLGEWMIAHGDALTHVGDLEEAVEHKLDLEAVRDAVKGLTDVERTALVCRVLCGLSTEETAREMGVGEEAVRSSLFRARQKVRKIVQRVVRGDTWAHD